MRIEAAPILFFFEDLSADVQNETLMLPGGINYILNIILVLRNYISIIFFKNFRDQL